MQFYSTRNSALRVSLQQAVLEGLPPDNGLYMPSEIPALPPAFFRDIDSYSFAAIGYEVARALLGDALPDAELRAIVEETLNFDAPLVSLDAHLHVLELFHGPTLAFKDFGARFMARLMARWVQGRTLHILVATSGDTGGAVAAGFYQVPGIEVIILYPSGKVSPLQEKQLTTLGHNITALEIDGSFDDCQAMVKQAFLDQDLRERLLLTSANSINIARLIPQSFYYFRAWQQLADKALPIWASVPSGNFGNLTAGLLAQRLGLPLAGFLAATNINDVVPAYLETGDFAPRPSVPTLSNAMDVGNPSNFARMQALFGSAWEAMRAVVHGSRYDDAQTRAAIGEVAARYGYQIDPHGAVAYLAARAHLHDTPASQVFLLETAHPAKFPEVVAEMSGRPVEIPARLAVLADRPGVSVQLPASYAALRAQLLAG
ncbi:MAG: threonine synthase [Bacteroidia bacterium]